MPVIKSAKKRVRTATKATIRNAKTKRLLRESVKIFNNTLASGKIDKIIEAQSKATSALDIATKKNVIHRNKADRRKRRLSAAVKAAIAKKAAIKKPAVKKNITKKTAPKKLPPKKSATKKAIAK
jgi:small subunit ribosomal protein S20